MLSVNLIERHTQAGRFEALVDEVAANGLGLPLPLRARLAQHASVTGAALGLRRLLDLTYGPTTLSRGLTQMLLDQQAPDGSFGQDPLATAAALAALDKLGSEQPQVGEAAAVSAARHRALAALATMQTDSGLFRGGDDRTEQDQALVSALILHLLIGSDAFRKAIRFADLMRYFERRQHRLEPDTHRLVALAWAGAPVRPRVSPAVAAIAA